MAVKWAERCEKEVGEGTGDGRVGGRAPRVRSLSRRTVLMSPGARMIADESSEAKKRSKGMAAIRSMRNQVRIYLAKTIRKMRMGNRWPPESW